MRASKQSLMPFISFVNNWIYIRKEYLLKWFHRLYFFNKVVSKNIPIRVWDKRILKAAVISPFLLVLTLFF
jgi:hypothetical protein